MTSAFIEFKGIMDMVIPNNGDPSPACDKVMAHQARLKSMSFDLPDNVLAMMIVCKIPPSMETVAQMMMVASKDENSTKSKDPEGIIEFLRASYETTIRNQRGGNQQRVRATLSQLLSAQRRLPESRLVPLVTTGRSSWST